MKALLISLGVIATITASATALAFIGLPYRPLGVEFLQGTPYGPIAISAEATGSPSPDQMPDADFDDRLRNGDFHILLGGGGNNTLGDGIDEVTAWRFDFRPDPQFDTFPMSTPLESAVLTLTLSPRSLDFSSDTVRISGLPEINPAIYDDLPQDTLTTVELELLDFYSSEDILQELSSRNGRINMVAGDDAIVSFGRLVLVSQASFDDGDPSKVNLSGQALLQGRTSGLDGTGVNLFGMGDVRSMRSVTTGSNGSFSVDLVPGEYRVIADREGWQPRSTDSVFVQADRQLEPIHLLLEGNGVCDGGIPGDDDTPRIIDVTEFEPDDPQTLQLNVELDQPARVWVEFRAPANGTGALSTPVTDRADDNHEVLLSQLEPDTLYCYQVFATFEEVSSPEEATEVSDSFPGSFITGSLPDNGGSDTTSGQ